MPRDIAVIVGSLRAGSLNRMAANALAAMAPETLRLEIVGMGDLPLYNQDLDDTPPEAWTVFRERVRRADGILFVTPEYNRSMPGALKNAVDVGSRPYGQGALNGKPAGVASLSPGTYGGIAASHHLRQSLVFLGMPVMPQPEAYWPRAGTFFDESGRLVNEKTREVMERFIQAYAAWVERFLGS